MTDPKEFIADTEDGQRSITITPVLITPATGITYITGQYNLTEGEVGVGSITFDNNKEWNFEGVSDIGEDVIEQIAGFIKEKDNTPSGFSEAEETITQPEDTIPEVTDILNFIVETEEGPVDVRVEMNYPFYDVTVAGTVTAQLEQDHHSNWFITTGQLNDNLLQAIGARITAEVTGVPLNI